MSVRMGVRLGRAGCLAIAGIETVGCDAGSCVAIPMEGVLLLLGRAVMDGKGEGRPAAVHSGCSADNLAVPSHRSRLGMMRQCWWHREAGSSGGSSAMRC